MTAETSTKTTCILFARHGRTALNAAGRLRGLANPPLDSTGQQEADRLAQNLMPLHPAMVLCSPLTRARQTADAVARRCSILRRVDTGFADRDYGEQTGRLRQTVLDEWGSLDAAPGVEPLESVGDRAEAALRAVGARHDGQIVVVVTHDAVIDALLRRMLGSYAEKIPTGSWTAVYRRPSHPWVVSTIGRMDVATPSQVFGPPLRRRTPVSEQASGVAGSDPGRAAENGEA
jgi:probable phosphoglycerate mutase